MLLLVVVQMRPVLVLLVHVRGNLSQSVLARTRIQADRGRECVCVCIVMCAEWLEGKRISTPTHNLQSTCVRYICTWDANGTYAPNIG